MAEAEPKSERARLAKESAKLTDKVVQRYSEERNEPHLASKLGGRSLRNNEPADVHVGPEDKPAHQIELKTMVDNSNNKITVKNDQMVRKADAEVKHGAPFHTVVYDDQKVFNANGEGNHGQESDRGIYYRRGAGAFRVGGMYKVRDHAELKRLLSASEDDLPEEAKPTPSWKEHVRKAAERVRQELGK